MKNYCVIDTHYLVRMNSVILGMPGETLANIVNTDIYLIDQIIKGGTKSGGRLLDAGCGEAETFRGLLHSRVLKFMQQISASPPSIIYRSYIPV